MNPSTVIHRSSLRGLRKCVACGKYNGTRALSCRNQQCQLSKVKSTSPSKKPSGNYTTTALLAVSLQTNGESCLYSVPNREKNPIRRSFVQITDRTISSDEDGCIISRNAICFVDTCKYDSHDLNISCKHIKWALDGNSRATVRAISLDVWNCMKYPADDMVRARLWEAYLSANEETPMVQQINEHTFAVGCDVSAAFPAGRLHVGINRKTNKKFKNKTGFDCSCKEDRIEKTNPDTCDHICFVIAAIKSCLILSEEFHRELSYYSSYFHGNEFSDQPLEICLPITDDFIQFSDDILNTSIVSIENAHHPIQIPSSHLGEEASTISDCGGTTLIDLESIEIINDPMANNNDMHNLELIDCQIELMDQFKLTDHIDLSSNEIHMEDADDLFGSSSIVDLSSLGMDLKLDPIVEDPKPFCVKSTNRKVNNHRRLNLNGSGKSHRIPRFDPSGYVSDSLMFDHWLESVVERINNSMDFNGDGKPDPLVFSVCHGFFNTLCMRFSSGVKRRLPLVSTIDTGSMKGLARFTWKFSNGDIIRNIFKTKSSTICDERIFRKCLNGRFKPISQDKKRLRGIEPPIGRSILPTKYSTVLKLKSASSNQRGAVFTIEWIPNVLPVSRFGEMRLVFQFCLKKNNEIIEVVSD